MVSINNDPNPGFWKAALEQLQTMVPSELFKAWLLPLEVVALEGNDLTIKVPSPFHQNFVRNHFEAKIISALHGSVGQRLNIRYVTPDQFEMEATTNTASFASLADPFSDNSQEKVSLRSQPNRRLIKATTGYIDTNHTFDSFIVSSSNQFAHAAARGVASHPGGKYNPLLIYGPSGLGKTHLLHAIASEILINNPQARICYLSAEQFVNGFIEAVQKNATDQFRNNYRSRFDVFLIDDIQFFAGKGRSEEEFFHTFNHLCGSHNQVVLTSDKPPKDLSSLEDRLITRLQQGLVVDVKPPDLETRIAILKSKAEAEDLYVPEEVCILIASHIRSNVRELEGALVRLSAEASINGSEISVEMAKEALSDLFQENRSNTVSIEAINKCVCQYFKISATELNSKSRARKYSEPRQIAMYLSKRYTKKTLQEIAQAFGGKDHSTVIHAIKKIESGIHTNVTLKKHVEDIQVLL